MNRWQLMKNKISWGITGNEAHTDRIEMAGKAVAAIVKYGICERGGVVVQRQLFYPVLRTIPNNTHASANQAYDVNPQIKLNGEKITEKPFEINFDGVIEIKSFDETKKILTTRHLFPSTDKPAYIEHIAIKNISSEKISIAVDSIDDIRLGRGTKGRYIFSAKLDGASKEIAPGEVLFADLIFTGRKIHDAEPEIYALKELSERKIFADRVFNESLVLETSNPQLDCGFAFAKLRACESIFDNECGLLHSPGGGSYYAAVWTNDQVEYQGPLAPFAGINDVNQAALNAYALYIPFMGSDYHKIPTSIISEGHDIWEGAGDRGDAAMYLYGLSRFLLAYGSKKTAGEYFHALEWCAEYCVRKMNAEGVVESDSDELEGRFPSGSANLCTSSLAYGGLVSTASIAKELGYADKYKLYAGIAEKLRVDIEKYFGGAVSGYDTYKYYKENDVLRAWICIPLTVGIYERSAETRRALFSDRLWTDNGILTQEGDNTFWDRATLYALRGIFNSGESEEAYKYLKSYTETRLLGDHVPYPVEAYPEGNQRHLSAESALYCRVITEGMAGITPSGFGSFHLKPSLPPELGFIRLKNIRAFGNDFDLEIKRNGDIYNVSVKLCDGSAREYICGNNSQIEIML